MAINHTRFGAETTSLVFVDFNSRIKEIAIDRSPRMMFDEFLRLPLQQKYHFDSTSCGVNQRMAKLKAW